MRLPLIWGLTLASLSLYAGETPRINELWISEAPPGISVNAGYFVIHNPLPEPIILVGVSSADYGRIEMHRNIDVNGITKMQAQSSISVAANDSLEFKPGGYHLMLFKPTKPVRAGGKIQLSFEFSDGSRQQLTADVRKLSTDHSAHSHH